MHSAIVMLASAAFLFSGASGQLQDCDPAETPAEPPCPYGRESSNSLPAGTRSAVV